MLDRTRIKSLLRLIGVYSTALTVCRALSPGRRRTHHQERDFYRGLVRPGDLCFDVGANVGQTIAILTELGTRVVSVEPNPHCVKVLRSIYSRSPSFQLEPVALGAEAGRARFHFRGTDATGSLRDDWRHGVADETLEVEVSTLDALIEKHGVPALCKIDVEGFEEHVLRGLHRPIPLILFEFHADELARAFECLRTIHLVAPITEGRIASLEPLCWKDNAWTSYEGLTERLANTDLKYGNIAVRTQPG
jgi:FkbM family methyltransferase